MLSEYALAWMLRETTAGLTKLAEVTTPDGRNEVPNIEVIRMFLDTEIRLENNKTGPYIIKVNKSVSQCLGLDQVYLCSLFCKKSGADTLEACCLFIRRICNDNCHLRILLGMDDLS